MVTQLSFFDIAETTEETPAQTAIYQTPYWFSGRKNSKIPLGDLLEECTRMCTLAGVETGCVLGISVNTRLKNVWGRCVRKIDPIGSPYFYIELNKVLFEDDASFEGLQNTVLHELCHTVKNCFNHGSEWKNAAQKIQNKYGIVIRSGNTAKEKGFNDRDPLERKPKYILTCEDCGAIFVRYRMPKTAVENNFRDYKCSCGGKIKRVYS